MKSKMMPDSSIIVSNIEDDIEWMMLRKWVNTQIAKGKKFRVEAFEVGGEKLRTAKQNRSLHVWCRQTAEKLNSAGLDQRTVLKPAIPIPWDEDSVKKKIWAPVMKAMFEVESTKDMESHHPSQILEVIAQHLAETQEFTPPRWPTIEEDMI